MTSDLQMAAELTGANGANAGGGVQEAFARAPLREFPRFDLSQGTEARQHLADQGFCIFGGAATRTELAHAKLLFWEWFEAQAGLGISRDDPRTLRSACWRALAAGESTFRSGLISQRGIGQSAFMWAVRTLPSVAAAFGAAWGVGADELVTGFDGCAVLRNMWLLEAQLGGDGVGEEDAEGVWAPNQRAAQWFHVDQHWKERPGLSTYQACDVGECARYVRV